MNLARVTAYHPETNKADLLFLATNQRVPGVRVMSPQASSSSGRVGQAIPDGQNSADPLARPAAGERALIACVAYYDGLPVVQGFLTYEDSELLFPDPDRVMDRTPSDFYHTVDGQGNAEWFHPGGAYVRIATDPAHEDLTGKDYQGKFAPRRNADKKVHIHIEQAGGLATVDIDPSGAIAITSKATLQADIDGQVTLNGKDAITVNGTGPIAVNGEDTIMVVAKGDATVKAPSILLDTAAARCTGTFTVDKLLTYKGGMAGSGGAGGAAAAIQGNVKITDGDVTADGISLTGHTHMEQGDGKDVSKPK